MGYLDARFGAYLIVAVLLIVTPGPDTALVTRNAFLAGKRAASFTTIGIGAGSVIWALASVLGIAILLEESALAFTIFKFAGAVYLGYLGLRILITTFQGHRGSGGSDAREEHGHASAASSASPSPQLSKLSKLSKTAAFRQGLLSNLLNPKAGAIFVTARSPTIHQPRRFPLASAPHAADV